MVAATYRRALSSFATYIKARLYVVKSEARDREGHAY